LTNRQCAASWPPHRAIWAEACIPTTNKSSQNKRQVMSMVDSPNVLSMNGITKSFPGVIALEDVDFSLRKGEVHGLVGENGAGKSTLIKVLTGVEHPDTGSIELEGKPIQVRSPQHSQEIGISTVYQEVNLCTNISVAENIMLGHEPHRFGSIDWKKMNVLATQAMKGLDIDIDVARPLGNYSLAIQQMVAIARSLEITSAKILILDEPTASITERETAVLFALLKKLNAGGLTIV
jgi:simple sugar transport system ATP-binding protein